MEHAYFPSNPNADLLQPNADLLPLGYGLDDQNFIVLTSDDYLTPEGHIFPLEQRVISFLTAKPVRDLRHKVDGVIVEALNLKGGGVDRLFIAEREYMAQTGNVHSALKLAGCSFGAAGLRAVCDLLVAFAEEGRAAA